MFKHYFVGFLLVTYLQYGDAIKRGPGAGIQGPGSADNDDASSLGSSDCSSIQSSQCDVNANCVVTGKRSFECRCKEGFEGTGMGVGSCASLELITDVIKRLPFTNTLQTILENVEKSNPRFYSELSDPKKKYTFFVPSDVAFATVASPKIVARLLEDDDLMEQTLRYHMLPNLEIDALSLCGLAQSPPEDPRASYATLESSLDGAVLKIHHHGPCRFKTVSINGAHLTGTRDVQALNGYVHQVNKLLIPQQVANSIIPHTVGEALEEQKKEETNLSTFTKLLEVSGLLLFLKETSKKFTVFAPDNEAWNRLNAELALNYHILDEYFYQPAALEKLQQLLKYHIVPGVVVRCNEVVVSTYLTTMLTDFPVKVGRECPQFGDCQSLSWCRLIVDEDEILQAGDSNIEWIAGNGVVHVVSEVLVPSEYQFPALSLELMSPNAMQHPQMKTAIPVNPSTFQEVVVQLDGSVTDGPNGHRRLASDKKKGLRK